jgi:hypothetical protein
LHTAVISKRKKNERERERERETSRMMTSFRYVCREWNRRHQGSDRLYHHVIYFITQPVYLDYSRGPWAKQILHDHYCYFKDEDRKQKE